MTAQPVLIYEDVHSKVVAAAAAEEGEEVPDIEIVDFLGKCDVQ